MRGELTYSAILSSRTIFKMKKSRLAIAFITLAGIFLRLWHIEFGLPHSFYADEPEIAELAIKYTYEIRGVIGNGDYYKLIPVSYVYGALPSYLFTLSTMIFSKISNLLGMPASKLDLYIAMRLVNSVLGFLIAPIVAYIFYRKTKRIWLSVLLYALLALNWKLIVHAHYVNADSLLTLLISASFLTTLLYYEKRNPDRMLTLATGILLGFAAGTKITALITLPLYIWFFYKERQPRNALALVFITFGAFAISNPFSLIFAGDFIFRIYEMLFKEGGLVFDSADYSYLKYVSALAYMVTPAVLLLSMVGVFSKIKKQESDKFDTFLILNITIYFIFFSIQSRRIDRWLLPILPTVLYFAVVTLGGLTKKINPKLSFLLVISILVYYAYFPVLLLFQFQRWTPKSAAYLWMKENTPELSTKLVYTEEGLDPMNKLPGAKVYQYEVYSSDGAQFFYPKDPAYYDYVVISSRPMENHKRTEVKRAFPEYSARWDKFEDTINSTEKFEMIRKFTLPKPNLIPLSDVYIYRNLDKKILPALTPVPIL